MRAPLHASMSLLQSIEHAGSFSLQYMQSSEPPNCNSDISNLSNPNEHVCIILLLLIAILCC